MKSLRLCFLMTTLMLCSIFTNIVSWDQDQFSMTQSAEGDLRSGLYLRWVPNPVLVMNGKAATSELTIEYRGPPMGLNISFDCPKSFHCPGNVMNDVTITHEEPLFFNFSFVPMVESPSPDDRQKILAVVVNDTYGIRHAEYLTVKVSSELSVELLSPLAMHSNRAWYLDHISNGTVCSYPIYSGSMCHRASIEATFRVTNYNNTEEKTGYFGMHMSYSILKKDVRGNEQWVYVSEIVKRNAAISIPPSGNRTLSIKSDPINGEVDNMEINIVFSKTSDFKMPQNMFFLNFREEKLAFAIMALARITTRCGLQIEMRVSESVSYSTGDFGPMIDFWNGTNLTLKIGNYRGFTMRDTILRIEDMVGPGSSFNYKRYWNLTKVVVGDMAPYETKFIDVTIYSKISGPHFVRAYIENEDADFKAFVEGEGMKAMPLFLLSGLELTYQGENYVKSRCDDDGRCIYFAELTKVRMYEKVDVVIKINSSRELEGDFGVSILFLDERGLVPYRVNSIADEEAEKDGTIVDKDLHGNGWLKEEDLIDIDIEGTDIEGKDTFLITLRPKFVGYFMIIPYIETEDHVLLFDGNMELHHYFETCRYCPYKWGTYSDIYKTIKVKPESKQKEQNVALVSSLMPLIIVNIVIGIVLFGQKRRSPRKRV